jgi:hypothetical protein
VSLGGRYRYTTSPNPPAEFEVDQLGMHRRPMCLLRNARRTCRIYMASTGTAYGIEEGVELIRPACWATVTGMRVRWAGGKVPLCWYVSRLSYAAQIWMRMVSVKQAAVAIKLY